MTKGKRYPHAARVERGGVAICATVVAEMGHIWREKSVSDVGIDGEIELVDPSTDKATGRLLLVQSKARTAFDGETDSSFRFTCTEDDLEYWLSGTAPVLLVMTHPDTGDAWFKNLDVWFTEDPTRRKSRIVRFDKDADRFTKNAARRLLDWGAPASSGLYLRPPPRQETLLSNLLRVDYMADSVHAAPSSISGWADANARLRKAGYDAVDDIVWRDGQVWSFRRLDEPPLDALADETPERLATDELADSKSDDDRRLLVRLLNNTLREVNRSGLAFDKKHRYLYFPATESLQPLVVNPTRSGRGRTVFESYKDKATGSRVVHYRHYALQFQFLHLDEGWFLALNPTYHYTIDGHRPSKFGGEYVKKIKRMEGHDAVGYLVKFWAGYLRTQHHLFSTPDQRLRFGGLAEFDVNHGIDDKYWKPDNGGAHNHSARQPQGVLDLGGQ